MYDTIIVGAGPAGLTAGIFATSRKLSTLVLDAKVAGGQLKFLYPTKVIHDYPSHHHIEARKLAELLVDHARESGCDIHENEEVKILKRRARGCRSQPTRASTSRKRSSWHWAWVFSSPGS